MRVLSADLATSVTSPKSEYRKSMFKNKDRFSLTQIKRRRRLNEVELRKQKRSNSAARRRNEIFLEELNLGTSFSLTKHDKTLPSYKEAELAGIQTALESSTSSLDAKLGSIQLLGELFSVKSLNVDQILHPGLHNCLARYTWSPDKTLALSSLTTLSIIASSSPLQADIMVEAGVTSELIKLLSSPTIQIEDRHAIQQQALYILMIITSDSSSNQQQVLKQGGLEALLEFLRELHPHYLESSPFQSDRGEESPIDERIAISFMYNLIKNLTALPSDFCGTSIGPGIATVLCNFLGLEDDYTISETCQTLASITSISPAAIDVFLTNAPLLGPRLVKVLAAASHDLNTQSAIVRILGNISLSSDVYIDNVLRWGTFSVFRPLLLSPTEDFLRKEACWAISNIVASNKRENIQAVIDNNLVPPLMNILSSDSVLTNVKREACWATCNMLSSDSVSLEQIKYFVSQGCLPPLANEMLLSMDNNVVLISLEALLKVLQAGNLEQAKCRSATACNIYADFIEEACGVSNINRLLSTTKNDQIFRVCCQIIDQYFPDSGMDLTISELSPANFGNTPNTSTGIKDNPARLGKFDDEMSDVSSPAVDSSSSSSMEPGTNEGVFVFSSAHLSSGNDFKF